MRTKTEKEEVFGLPPYSACWTSKPYLRKDGRMLVSIKYGSRRKTSVSYPKFLVEVHLGKYLTDAETVHHKDGNFSNNALSNLEVLKRDKHAQVHARMPDTKELYCAHCGEKFLRARRRLFYYSSGVKHVVSNPVCSVSCRLARAATVNKPPIQRKKWDTPHGTYARYRGGCRCRECRDANNSYSRASRAKKHKK